MIWIGISKYKKGFYKIKDTPKCFEIVDIDNEYYYCLWFITHGRNYEYEFSLNLRSRIETYTIDEVDGNEDLEWELT